MRPAPFSILAKEAADFSEQLIAKVLCVLSVLDPGTHFDPLSALGDADQRGLRCRCEQHIRLVDDKLLQPAADAVKAFFKEEVIPNHVDKIVYVIAPALAVVPALIIWAVIPIANGVPAIADVNIGFLWLALAAIWVGGYAVLQRLAGLAPVGIEPAVRAEAGFGNPVFLGAWLVLVTPLLLAEGLAEPGATRWPSAVAAGLCLPALLGTGSRGAPAQGIAPAQRSGKRRIRSQVRCPPRLQPMMKIRFGST